MLFLQENASDQNLKIDTTLSTFLDQKVEAKCAPTAEILVSLRLRIGQNVFFNVWFDFILVLLSKNFCINLVMIIF